jgi:hypothetical protein
MPDPQKLPIRGPEILDVEAEMVLRRAYMPSNSKEEREAGLNLFKRALRLVIQAACENPAFVHDVLRGIGFGRWASMLLISRLRKACGAML